MLFSLLGMVNVRLNTEESKIFQMNGGTAVNVQAMVFGNMGDSSCTGLLSLETQVTEKQILRRILSKCTR